ncbi:MAG: hypothetical protein QM765_13475 [Myxococcales bacterium]
MRLLFIENHADFANIVTAKFLTAHEVVIVRSLAEARRVLASYGEVVTRRRGRRPKTGGRR